MTDEKQAAAIKQRAAEIASFAFSVPRTGTVYATPASVLDAVERALREGMAMNDARFKFLLDNEFDLRTFRESCGDDEYYIWWQVVKGKKSISGHPLGSPQAAIDAAIERNKK